MRKLMAALITLALVVAAFAVGRAERPRRNRDDRPGQLGGPRDPGGLFHAGRQRHRRWRSRVRPLQVPVAPARPQGQGRAQRSRLVRSCHASSARQRYGRTSSSFLMICPTMLLGVEAPAVRPTLTWPGRQPAPRRLLRVPLVVDGAPTGRWRTFVGRHQALGIGDVKRRYAVRADSAPDCRYCCCCSRRPPASGRAAARRAAR